MSIQDIVLKIKGWTGKGSVQNNLIKMGYFAISILALTLSFIGGRISVGLVRKTHADIQIIYPPLVSNDIPRYEAKRDPAKASVETKALPEHPAKPPKPTVSAQGSFAGSKTGKTYYPTNCKALNRVKPENRVYFVSREQASEAGYSPSKSCTP